MTDPQSGRAGPIHDSMLTPLHDTTPSTILVVEDDPVTFALLRAVIESAGHRFLGAHDATEAASVLPDADLVLLDVMLGETDGWQFCRHIKTNVDPLLPVIMVTGRTSPDDIVRTFDSGADDYIPKPFQAQELLARIGSRLRVRNAEAALITLYRTAQSAEIRYRSLFDANPHPLVVYDLDTMQFLAVNHAACVMYGYTEEELLKLGVRDVQAPEDAALVAESVATQHSGLTNIGIWRQRTRDGRMLETDLTVHNIEFADRRARLVLVLDVTEQRAAERAVRDAENRLREGQRLEAVGRLAGGVAHDFNNMLTAILGNADEILRGAKIDAESRGQIEDIRGTAERAAVLTRQLLAYGRRQILQPQQLDVNDVVTALDPLMRASAGDSIPIDFALAASLPPVLADPQQIRQVIINIVTNAAEAMPTGGRIEIGSTVVVVDAADAARVGLQSPGAYVRLTVIDDGQGMSAATAARALEPFFTTKPQGLGSGLGLSTAYGIVQQSGGTLSLATEAWRGTTVTVLLPVADPADVAKRAQVARRSQTSGRTVLLVEDEPAVRNLIRRVLERSGFDVMEAENGADALVMARDAGRPIDLLVTDVVMPILGGLELATALAGEQPDIRILFISGYNEEAIHQHGVLLPGSEFLPKPFSPDELRQKVRDILDSHSHAG